MRKLQRSNLFLDKETLHLHRLRKMGYQDCRLTEFDLIIFFRYKIGIVFYSTVIPGTTANYIIVFTEEGYNIPISYDGTVLDYLDKVFNYLDKL